MWVATATFALEGDTKEPITLESNSGFFDDKEGVSIYTGDVIIIQGSLRMDADKVVIYLDEKREIQKMIATGNLVKVKQTPEGDKEDLNGKALQVDYSPLSKRLIMTGKAVLWQGANKTASEYIEYDLNSEVIKAGDGMASDKRVHVTLQPSSEPTKD
ncbi:MAG: lipopolysaccharide transport periplasmic protein LptA [Methyloprofundus sp.]|nr:lipopolysaccharide transport periplasmic protein LptA [Methyloprofundus sp.]